MTLVPEVEGLSTIDCERLALQKLNKKVDYRLNEYRPLDVIKLLHSVEDDGLNYSITDLPAGIEGRALPNGDLEIPEFTYLKASEDNHRARFTIVHECWHGWIHCTQLQEKLEHGKYHLNRRGQIPAYKDPEWQANTLAAAMLMPLPAMARLANEGNLDYWTVSKLFKVSNDAAKIRISTIKNKSLFSILTNQKVKAA